MSNKRRVRFTFDKSNQIPSELAAQWEGEMFVQGRDATQIEVEMARRIGQYQDEVRELKRELRELRAERDALRAAVELVLKYFQINKIGCEVNQVRDCGECYPCCIRAAIAAAARPAADAAGESGE